MSRSDVVMNPFIFLLTCYRPKHSSLYQLGKLISIINNVRKAKLDSRRVYCTEGKGLISF